MNFCVYSLYILISILSRILPWTSAARSHSVSPENQPKWQNSFSRVDSICTAAGHTNLPGSYSAQIQSCLWTRRRYCFSFETVCFWRQKTGGYTAPTKNRTTGHYRRQNMLMSTHRIGLFSIKSMCVWSVPTLFSIWNWEIRSGHVPALRNESNLEGLFLVRIHEIEM